MGGVSGSSSMASATASAELHQYAHDDVSVNECICTRLSGHHPCCSADGSRLIGYAGTWSYARHDALNMTAG